MNRHPSSMIVAGLSLASSCAHAQSRISASYTVSPDTLDGGGQRTASALYTAGASVGGIAGISTVTAPSETARQGYIAQLYGLTALQLAPATATVNENATLQLSASLLLDDATLIIPPLTSILWSVQSGPLPGISTAGLATAAPVYQDTTATLEGRYFSLTATLPVKVKDTVTDNFGLYAADGLPDLWQVQHFGVNNPDAAPGLDFDNDGQTNLFEYRAGVIPTDPASVFTMSFATGPPGQQIIGFSPWLPDRTYTVLTSSSLATAGWTPLVLPPVTSGTVTDTAATGSRKFYRIEIAAP